MDANKIIKDIKKNYTNNGTICVKITEYLTYIKNLKVLNETHIKAQTIFRGELFKLKTIMNNTEAEPFDRSLQLEKLRLIWLKSNCDPFDKLLTGLYIWIPALRSDYIKGNCDFTSETIFIKNLIKTNTDQSKTIVVPKELKELIKNLEKFPSNNTIFSIQLKKASLNIFQKGLTINTYRHIWTEYGYRNYNKDEIEQLAKDMNHTLTIHNKHYLPKIENKIVYK